MSSLFSVCRRMRRSHLGGALLVLGMLTAGASARADVITEAGTSFGNTRASAFNLDGRLTADTNRVDDNVYGQNGEPTASITGAITPLNDVDYFSFTGVAGQQFYFDIDNTRIITSSQDSFLSLFNDQGALLASDDDGGSDQGSTSGLDAFIGVYTLPADGVYYVAVSAFDNQPVQGFSGGTRTLIRPQTGEPGSGADGGTAAITPRAGSGTFDGGSNRTFSYTLHVTTTSSTPTPGPTPTPIPTVMPNENPSLIVTTAQDVVNAFDNLTSLREALAFAATQAGDDTVNFSAAAFPLPAPAGGYVLTVNGELVIDSNVSVVGLGAGALTISGNSANRAFHVTAGAGQISGMTLTNGNTINDIGSNQGGGAVIIDAGASLEMTDCTVSNSTAVNAEGGGVLVLGSLTANRCAIIGNTGGVRGGGINVNGGIARLTNTTVANNRSSSNSGGALDISGGGSAFLAHCTVSGNSAPNVGGILNEVDGALQLQSTIVAGNFSSNAGPTDIQSQGTLAASDFNLIGVAGGVVLSGTNNRVGTAGAPLDARLNALALNGGATPNLLPRADSPAVDGGQSNITVDQRNLPRPLDAPGVANTGNGSDIGAIELQVGEAPGTATPVGVADNASTSEDVALSIAVLDNDTDPDTANADLRIGAGSIADVRGGTATLNADNRTVTFTPALETSDGNTPGGFGFTYVVTDGVTSSAPVAVTIAVAAANDAPVVTSVVATPTTASVDGTFQVFASATDSDSTDLFLTTIVRRADGTALFNVQSTSGTALAFDLSTVSGETRGEVLTIEVTANDGALTSAPVTATVTLTEAGSLVVTTLGDVVDGQDGLTSLREAILFANREGNTAPETISFAVAGVIRLGSTLPDLASAAVTGPLTISNTQADDVTISGDSNADGGGDNRILVTAAESNVTLNNLILSDARAINNAGGSAVLNFGPLVIVNCTFSNNSAGTGVGGAILAVAPLTISGSTFSGNSAETGGAIYSNNVPLTITNSTFTGNVAASQGGAIFSFATLTLDSCTISGNTATRINGGGIWNGGGSAGGFGTDPSVTLRNSIVAGNTAPAGENIFGAFVDNGFNLTSGDPQLGALADNGGPTQTLLPLTGSPAIDAGQTDLALDQRGATRPQGAGDDIGAVERQIPVLDLDVTRTGTDSIVFFTPGGESLDLTPNNIALSSMTEITGALVTLPTRPDSEAEILTADTTGTGLAIFYSATSGTLTIGGTGTAEQFRQVLASVRYNNSSTSPTLGDRTAIFSVTDREGTVTATAFINRGPDNAAPVIANVESTELMFVEGSPAVAVAPSLTITDANSTNLSRATVEIRDGFTAGEEVLALSSTNAIQARFDAQTGLLELSGIAPLGDYQTALRGVTYRNSAQGRAGSRTVRFQVFDSAGAASNFASRNVNLRLLNVAPTISAIANQTTGANTATPALSFTVGDSRTPAANLAVRATSSNQELVPNANITLGGEGENRTVTVTPATGMSGVTTLTLTVSDEEGATATTSFTLAVDAIPTPTPPPTPNPTPNPTPTPAPVNTAPFVDAVGTLTGPYNASLGIVIPIRDADGIGDIQQIDMELTKPVSIRRVPMLRFVKGQGVFLSDANGSLQGPFSASGGRLSNELFDLSIATFVETAPGEGELRLVIVPKKAMRGTRRIFVVARDAAGATNDVALVTGFIRILNKNGNKRDAPPASSTKALNTTQSSTATPSTKPSTQTF